MRYIVAGYVVILSLLFLYSVLLVWRRTRLKRAVAQVATAGMPEGSGAAGAPGALAPEGGRVP